MNFETALLVCVAVGIGLCAGLWYAGRTWLGLGLRARAALAIVLPLMAGGAFLLIDGSPFNGVIAILFGLPLLLAEALTVVLLERRVAKAGRDRSA